MAKAKDAKADGKSGTEAKKDKPRPEKITWAEQRKWRDGTPAQLPGRRQRRLLPDPQDRVHEPADRDGADRRTGRASRCGSTANWCSPPPRRPPVAPPVRRRRRRTAKAADDDEEPAPDPDAFDIDAILGRGRSKTEKKFRIGLRAGRERDRREGRLRAASWAGGPVPCLSAWAVRRWAADPAAARSHSISRRKATTW